ncbi:hypothetical protein DID78_06330 [Candidatus Marinamargulisbacteria bacterium SCGC AG-343-D04]|nr:hypothetical protein DID78_06330 [Candidatus Marinamargulisbacteria bacterium SCGC AG-343-D04]
MTNLKFFFTKTSLERKIIIYAFFAISFLILLSLGTIYLMITIKDKINTSTTLTLPIVTISKDLNYLVEKHSQFFIDNLIPNLDYSFHSYKNLENIESQILHLNDALIKLSDSLFLRKDHYSSYLSLSFQLRKIDKIFNNYIFHTHRLLNILELRKFYSKREELKILLEKKDILLNELHVLNDIISDYEKIQSQNIRSTIHYSLIGFLLMVIFINLIYIIIWRQLILQVRFSFKEGIRFVQDITHGKSSNTEALSHYVVKEIREFVDIVSFTIMELHHSQKELDKKTKQLKTIRDDERKHIAQHLHDHLGQNITALKLECQVLKQQNPNFNPESIQTLERVKTTIDDSIYLIKQITHNLGIPHLNELGLIPSIKSLVKKRNELGLTQFQLTLSSSLNDFGSQLNLIIFQCIQEGLINILKHSKASLGLITLKTIGSELIIHISDNGIGLSKDAVYSMGLSGIKSIVEKLNGKFHFKNQHPNGTLLEINLPIDSQK